MKLVVLSDIHLNSFFSKKEKFLKFLGNLSADILVINGDLYDLYVGPPKEDIIQEIKKNSNIKSIVYIKGNHDFYIKDHLPSYNVQEVFRINDLVITHGHQYDSISSEIPSEKGFSKTICVVRNFIEKTFHFNVRILFKKLTFGLIDKKLVKSHDRAIEENPGKKVILGHTHLPMNNHPYYNCGCMCDEFFSHMVVDIDEGGESKITLINET